MKGVEAGHAADTTHSGKVGAGVGTSVGTIPQATLLDETKVFTVCYAESTGDNTDRTWRDSYIRVRMTKLTSLSHHGVTHLTNGQIAREGSMVEYIRGAVITPVKKMLVK